jgi:hypothetical protein
VGALVIAIDRAAIAAVDKIPNFLDMSSSETNSPATVTALRA